MTSPNPEAIQWSVLSHLINAVKSLLSFRKFQQILKLSARNHWGQVYLYCITILLRSHLTPLLHPTRHAGLLLTPGLCQLLSSPWDNSFFPISVLLYLPQPKNICPVQWTWTWANFGRWWGTGRPGKLQSMGSQRVGHHWATEQQQQQDYLIRKPLPFSMSSFYLSILICFMGLIPIWNDLIYVYASIKCKLLDDTALIVLFLLYLLAHTNIQ